MSDIANLEMRIRALEEGYRRLSDIEAIKKLRAKYWRCIRERLWDDLVDCFAEDAALDYGFGIQLRGKKAIAQFFKERMAASESRLIPQGHNPEIDITSDMTARGRWLLDSLTVDAKANTGARLGVCYNEEYAKEKGEWKIANQKVSHIYRQAIAMKTE